VGWDATLLPPVGPRFTLCYSSDGLVGPCGYVRRGYMVLREAFQPSPHSVPPLCRWVGFLHVGCVDLWKLGMGFFEIGACCQIGGCACMMV